MKKRANFGSVRLSENSVPASFNNLVEAWLTKIDSDHARKLESRLREPLSQIYEMWGLPPEEILHILLEYEPQEKNFADLDRLISNPKEKEKWIYHVDEVIKRVPAWNSRMQAHAIDPAPLQQVKTILEGYVGSVKRRTPRIALRYCGDALERYFERKLGKPTRRNAYRKYVVELLENCFPTWEPEDSLLAYKEMGRLKLRPLLGSGARYIKTVAVLRQASERHPKAKPAPGRLRARNGKHH